MLELDRSVLTIVQSRQGSVFILCKQNIENQPLNGLKVVEFVTLFIESNFCECIVIRWKKTDPSISLEISNIDAFCLISFCSLLDLNLRFA